MTISIRPYEDRDLDALIGLAREIQAHEYALYDRMKPPEEIGAWYVDHLKTECGQHAGTILIAEEHGRVLAYATILTHIIADEVEEVDHVFARVGDLSVTQARRGQGIGRALLAECERRAIAAGRDELHIGVIAQNGGARRIYERFGFTDFAVNMRKKIA